ncbi:MAG TPA: DUF488 family protein [Nocardioides sp.]
MRVARVYDMDAGEEAVKILVDRLWPRGIRKDDPRIDEWCPDVAPSTALRKWFAHRPEVFDEFAQRYRDELDGDDGRAALARVRELADGRSVVLLTATRDVEHSQATVLAEVLADLP